MVCMPVTACKSRQREEVDTPLAKSARSLLARRLPQDRKMSDVSIIANALGSAAAVGAPPPLSYEERLDKTWSSFVKDYMADPQFDPETHVSSHWGISGWSLGKFVVRDLTKAEMVKVLLQLKKVRGWSAVGLDRVSK